MIRHLTRQFAILNVLIGIIMVLNLDSFQQDYRCPERYNIRLGATLWVIPYCTTDAIGEPNADIQRIVIMLHGADDIPKYYFDELITVATENNITRTLIMAPHFSRQAGLYADESVLMWLGTGWEYQWGQDASNPTSVPLASYDVLDSLLEYLVQGQFPNLQSITIVGFSGGGQYTNRYAAANPLDPYLQAIGIEVRYVITSPGSYLYFDNRRRVGDTLDEFAVPPAAITRACPDWNEYGIGLEAPYRYISQWDARTLMAQYAARDVYYLIGAEDTMTGFDCRHDLEGSHRYERALVYFNYVATLQDNPHQMAVAAGIGHEFEIYRHPCAVVWIFYTQTSSPCTPYDVREQAKVHD
jgi:hypothetical protein